MITDNSEVIRTLEEALHSERIRADELFDECVRLRAALGQVHTVCYSMTKTREIIKAALLGGGENV